MITKEKNKGNIPLDIRILNKYSGAREIFDNANQILKNKKITIKVNNISEIKNLDLDMLKIGNLKNLAYEIFNKYHTKNMFKNKDKLITVTKHGIEESIEKIYNNFNQRKLLKEHLIIFSCLGDIIENAYLVNQTRERKNRKDLLYWSYYLDNLLINDIKLFLEFDVRSMEDGSNQYRIQRLEKTSIHDRDINIG